MEAEKISLEDHIKRHKELHRAFDELLADFLTHTEKNLANTTLLEFMAWSFSQTVNSDDKEI